MSNPNPINITFFCIPIPSYENRYGYALFTLDPAADKKSRYIFAIFSSVDRLDHEFTITRITFYALNDFTKLDDVKIFLQNFDLDVFLINRNLGNKSKSIQELLLNEYVEKYAKKLVTATENSNLFSGVSGDHNKITIKGEEYSVSFLQRETNNIIIELSKQPKQSKGGTTIRYVNTKSSRKKSKTHKKKKKFSRKVSKLNKISKLNKKVKRYIV